MITQAAGNRNGPFFLPLWILTIASISICLPRTLSRNFLGKVSGSIFMKPETKVGSASFIGVLSMYSAILMRVASSGPEESAAKTGAAKQSIRARAFI